LEKREGIERAVRKIRAIARLHKKVRGEKRPWSSGRELRLVWYRKREGKQEGNSPKKLRRKQSWHEKRGILFLRIL